MALSECSPREPRGGASSIYESSNPFDHYGGSRYTSHFSPGSMPMRINMHREQTEDHRAPPPLPPPKFLGPPGHSTPFGTGHNRDLSRGSETPSYGSLDHSPTERSYHGKHETGRLTRHEQDEGYHSLASTLSHGPDSAPKMFMSHDQFKFRPRGNEYDSSMLKKFTSRGPPENRSPPSWSALSASVNEVLPRRHPSETRQLPSLSLPIRNGSSIYNDSPSASNESSTQSAISPRGMQFHGFGGDYRSPIDPADRSPPYRAKRLNSGSVADDVTVSTQGSYENVDEMDFSMDDAGMGRLHLEEGSARMDHKPNGQKRRASSPLGEEMPLQGLPGAGELLRRREGLSRASPQPRLTIPQSSMSSLSSGRTGSYAPSLPLTATSGTSMTSSFGRRSPPVSSPGGLSPVDGICHSPFTSAASLTHSPRSAIMRVPHQRQLSESRPLASPRKLTDLPKSGMSRIQGFYMCDCCPKKPKKFESLEELHAHTAEKQYECSFCGNRFKNKNEAERHQNSLHVRRHSWSCSALHMSGYDKAFHESSNKPGEADNCGYCGEEFLRSGAAGRIRHATDQDWDDRLRHLQEVHKFRECNSSKKFYRADHFRQHLKHSHAGTSGKWTNMLETACMIEEEPPQPR